MSRTLALLAACALGAGASAQVCTTNFWKNDSLPDIPSGTASISIIPGLCEGEAVGTVFQMTAGMAPQKLNQVAVGFAHSSGGGGFTATCNVEIYEGPVTFSGSNATLGTKIFDLGQSQGASMQLTSSGVNTFDLSNFNIVVSDDSRLVRAFARQTQNQSWHVMRNNAESQRIRGSPGYYPPRFYRLREHTGQ